MDFIGDALGGGTMGTIFGLMQSVADGSLEALVDSLPMFIEAGMDMLLNLIDGVLKALPVILAKLPTIINTIIGVLTNKDSLNTIINGLLQMAIMIVQALPEIIASIVDAIPMLIETLIEVFIQNIPMFFKLGIAIGVAIMEGIINLIIGGINAIIRLINKIPFVDIPMIPKADLSGLIPKFADGRVPCTRTNVHSTRSWCRTSW